MRCIIGDKFSSAWAREEYVGENVRRCDECWREQLEGARVGEGANESTQLRQSELSRVRKGVGHWGGDNGRDEDGPEKLQVPPSPSIRHI